MTPEVRRCVDDEAELERVTDSLGSVGPERVVGTISDHSSHGSTSLSEFCSSVLSFARREAQPLFDEGEKASSGQTDGVNGRSEASCGNPQDGKVARDSSMPSRAPPTLQARMPSPLLTKREETFDQAFPSLGITKAIAREPKRDQRRKIQPAKIQGIEVNPCFVANDKPNPWIEGGPDTGLGSGSSKSDKLLGNSSGASSNSRNSLNGQSSADSKLSELERRFSGERATGWSKSEGAWPTQSAPKRADSLATRMGPLALSDQKMKPLSWVKSEKPCVADTPGVSGNKLAKPRKDTDQASEAFEDKTAIVASLSNRARRLAKLHGAVLCSPHAIFSLESELEFLYALLALPVSTTDMHEKNLPAEDAVFRQGNGLTAHLYAISVLSFCKGLISALDPETLRVLVAHSSVQKYGNDVLQAAEQGLQKSSALWCAPKTYEAVGPPRGALHLSLGNSDASMMRRTPSEQRQVSNREACRDGFLRLLEEASGLLNVLLPGTAGAATGLSGKAPGKPPHDADEVAMWVRFQLSCKDLLGSLRPDSFPFLAELFIGALLEAAATGEALLDNELRDLASRDMPRFARLNKRLQGAHGVTPDGSRFPSSRGNTGRQRGALDTKTHTSSDAAGSNLARTLSIVSACPAWQRLFCLVVLAADSARLDACLLRCARCRLQKSVSGIRRDGERNMGELVVASTALSGFISVLQFTQCDGVLETSDDDGVNRNSMFWPAVGAQDLKDALCIEQPHLLPYMVPWVTCYTRFLHLDGASASCKVACQLMGTLRALASLPALNPGSPGFGPLARCLRGALDSFASSSPLFESADVELGQQFLPSDWQITSPKRQNPLLEILSRPAHQRLVLLCCSAAETGPRMLDHAHHHQPLRRTARKITPSAPSSSSAASTLLSNQTAVLHAVSPAQPSQADTLRAQLQRSFLDQYSGDDRLVKLRDVVGFASDAIGTAVAEEVGSRNRAQAVEQAVESLRESLDEAVRELVTGKAKDKQIGNSATDGSVMLAAKSAANLRAISMLPKLLEELAQRCQKDAAVEIETRAKLALKGLLPPGLEPAAAGTAAAIVAENALINAERRFMSVLPGKLTAELIRAAELMAARLVKERAARGE